MGLSMLAAGCAIAVRRALPVLLGWLAVAAGTATVLTVFAPDTPISAAAGAAFLPALLLAIVFRIWAGLALTRPLAATRTGSVLPGRS